MKVILEPKNDKVFKLLYGAPQNQDILKDLLENILQEKIEDMRVMTERFLQGPYLQSKDMKNDIFIETKDTLIILEMQRRWHPGLEKRMEIYATRTMVDYLKMKQGYHQMKKIVVITIIDFHYSKLKQVVNKTVRTIEPQRQTKLFNTIEYYMIDLVLFRKQQPDFSNPLHQHLLCIDYQRKELLEMLAKTEERVRKVMEELHTLQQDEEVRKYIYDIETAEMIRKVEKNAWIEWAEKRGKKSGEKQGRMAEKRAMIKNMLEAGMQEQMICQVTNISAKELAKIKEQCC